MKALALHPSSRLLDRAYIAAPCPAKWEDMVGDERTRFCGQCAKNVYDVSAMTADEAEALIRATEGRACLRLYRRKDGTVLTSDCPVGLAERAYQQAKRAVLASVALVVTLTAALFGGFTTTCKRSAPEPLMGKVAVPVVVDVPEEMNPGDRQVLMGEPAFVPPIEEPRPVMGRMKVR